MVDRISKEKRSKIMSAIRSKDTKPEITLRKGLWKFGLRFRIYYGKEKDRHSISIQENCNICRWMLLAWLSNSFSFTQKQ